MQNANRQADSVPANLDLMRRIIPQVDIFRYVDLLQTPSVADRSSPNHVEALSLCSIAPSSTEAIEKACIMLASLGPKKAVVIRAGAMGACYTLSSSPLAVAWIPAYWTESESDQVVDVTGAGNGFLGGLCAGLDEGKDVRDGEIGVL